MSNSQNQFRRFFHLHPEVPGVAVVVGVFLFFGAVSTPKINRWVPLAWHRPAAVQAVESLLREPEKAFPAEWLNQDCQKEAAAKIRERIRETRRNLLRRQLEQRARERSLTSPRVVTRSRAELI